MQNNIADHPLLLNDPNLSIACRLILQELFELGVSEEIILQAIANFATNAVH